MSVLIGTGPWGWPNLARVTLMGQVVFPIMVDCSHFILCIRGYDSFDGYSLCMDRAVVDRCRFDESEAGLSERK